MFRLSQDGKKIAKIILIGLLLSLVLGSFITILAIGLLLLFRDESRVITNDSAILSPVDGIVLSVENNVQVNLSDKYDSFTWNKITISNGILDIHTSRMPIKGKIEDIVYSPGDSETGCIYKQNEKISWVISGIKQCVISHSVNTIFHFVSCKVKRNQYLNIGETYANNLIGATVELYVPSELKIEIAEGQRVVASETPLTEEIVLRENIKDNND